MFGTKCDRDKAIYLQKEGINQIELRHAMTKYGMLSREVMIQCGLIFA